MTDLNRMFTLTQIADHYKTDKSGPKHTFFGKSYTDIYAHYFEHMRKREFVFLEIGVFKGASLKMWSSYFPNAKIVGIDIDPRAAKNMENSKIKADVHIGSQDDEVFLKSLVDQYGEFGIVLDDGSHINEMTLKTFEILNKHTTGFYVIEDLRNSYLDLTKYDTRKRWPGMKHNGDYEENNAKNRPDFDRVFLDLIREMDHRQGIWTGFHFHQQILILEKNNAGLNRPLG